jgi:hypothetical protein
MAGILYLEDQGLSFTGKAVETISGGQIVKVVSGANVLSSTSNLGNTVEIALCDAVGDIGLAAGIAINTGASGARLGVATAGIHGLYAAEAITAGWKVLANGNVATADSVLRVPVAITSGAECLFGTALSYAASGQLCAVQLR